MTLSFLPLLEIVFKVLTIGVAKVFAQEFFKARLSQHVAMLVWLASRVAEVTTVKIFIALASSFVVICFILYAVRVTKITSLEPLRAVCAPDKSRIQTAVRWLVWIW